MTLRILAAALAFAAAGTQAAPLITPGDTWQYSFSAPAAGWQVGSDAGSWNSGLAPFSNCGPLGGSNCSGFDPAGLFNAGTPWSADGADGNDLWVRKLVDFSGFDLNTVSWDLGVDNGFALFINGTQVAAANAEGFTSRWEYGGAVSAGLLNAGLNWVAVALEDHGGLTAFDMQMSATPVPEPQTYALMLAGLGVLGFVARRRRA